MVRETQPKTLINPLDGNTNGQNLGSNKDAEQSVTYAKKANQCKIASQAVFSLFMCTKLGECW